MAFNNGRSSRRYNGPRRTGYRRPSRSYGRTRRGGRRQAPRGRAVAMGALGIAGGLLAVNAGIIGAASTSRAVRELAGSGKSVVGFFKSRRVKKAALKVSTAAFHASRVRRMAVRRPKLRKLKRVAKTRRWGKR